MTDISYLTIYRPDGSSETLRADLARNRTYFQPDEWSLTKPPPLNWERTVPKYKATRNLHPSHPRHRVENPFASMSDSDCYQYCEKSIAAGEIVETKSWPHPSFRPAGPIDEPANYAAERVLSYFNGAMKSRLGLSPFRGGRIELSDGISGPLPQHVSTPHVKPMNLRPVA